MNFEEFIEKSWCYDPTDYHNDSRWKLLKRLYVLNYVYDLGRDYSVLPKKIHQIWLGGEFPKVYHEWAESWKKFNPTWEYRLWTDKDLNDVHITDKNVFSRIRNLGKKSDYLRYHILNQYGGLYVDTDFECLKPFDDFTHANFVTGIGYPSKIELYIGLIASTPNHPILKRMIRSMHKSSLIAWEPFNSTGTYRFTKVFFDEVKGYMPGVIAMPMEFFYPFPNHKGHEMEDGRKYITDLSYAIHHWEVSWSRKKHKMRKDVS